MVEPPLAFEKIFLSCLFRAGEYGGPKAALQAGDHKAVFVLAEPLKIPRHNIYEFVWFLKTGLPRFVSHICNYWSISQISQLQQNVTLISFRWGWWQGARTSYTTRTYSTKASRSTRHRNSNAFFVWVLYRLLVLIYLPTRYVRTHPIGRPTIRNPEIIDNKYLYDRVS